MAAYDIWDALRNGELSHANIDNLCELLQAVKTEPEEVESVVGAMHEILLNRPISVMSLDDSLDKCVAEFAILGKMEREDVW